MAVRTRIDIFTENLRKIMYIDSECFGRVAFGAVGAMMVGSIQLTVESGQRVKRMDEAGFFAFGGMV
jgi:phosphatidylserine decarboxylase